MGGHESSGVSTVLASITAALARTEIHTQYEPLDLGTIFLMGRLPGLFRPTAPDAADKADSVQYLKSDVLNNRRCGPFESLSVAFPRAKD